MSSHSNDSLQIEKQKTLRLMMKLGATLLLALCALYIVFQGTKDGGSGKVDFDLSSGKVSLSLEKPIVDQVGLKKSSTSNTHQKSIQFTEGKIENKKTIQALKELAPSTPTQFSGNNFINYSAGFLLSVQNPNQWKIGYNPAGESNPGIAINTIYNDEGSHLNIGISESAMGMNIEQFVTLNVQSMIQSGAILQAPEVTYDYDSQTAFAIFTNPQTRGESYQKVIVDTENDRVLVASANYNPLLSSPEAINDLTNMIATFTSIDTF